MTKQKNNDIELVKDFTYSIISDVRFYKIVQIHDFIRVKNLLNSRKNPLNITTYHKIIKVFLMKYPLQ